MNILTTEITRSLSHVSKSSLIFFISQL